MAACKHCLYKHFRCVNGVWEMDAAHSVMPRNLRRIITAKYWEQNRERLAALNADPEFQKRRNQRMTALSASISRRKRSGTLHILRTDQHFFGRRSRVWSLIREGMTIQDLCDVCERCGLTAREAWREINKFINAYRCIKVIEAGREI